MYSDLFEYNIRLFNDLISNAQITYRRTVEWAVKWKYVTIIIRLQF